MESLREMVTESLQEIETRKEDAEREAFLEALGNYIEKVKEGLRQCGLHYKYNHDYFRVEYNGLTAACGFVSDLVSIPRSATTVDIIGRDSHLLNRYREAMVMINTLREHQLDDLEEAVGGDLQELERKVEEAEKVYINKHGEGSYAIKRILEKMLNRLRNNGQVDIKFYDINLAHPDDEDIISQACDIKVKVDEFSYRFHYVISLVGRDDIDGKVVAFCETNGLSSNMVPTMKNLYVLRCCLEMAFNHVEVLGSDDKVWFMRYYHNVLDMYYKENETLARFMGKVYLARSYHDKDYCFSNT